MSCDSINSSSTPSSGFPNSATMQQLSTNYQIIWTEISLIQQAILETSSQCQPGGGRMSTIVGGNTPMTFISGVSSIDVLNGGSGYYIDTPSVKFIPPRGSSGSGATGTLVTNGGNILEINITSGGSGYQPVNSTLNVSSILGTGANLELLVNGVGSATGVSIIDGGTGYTVNDTVVATRAVAPNPAYVDAIFKITSVSLTGSIIEVVILEPGSGYQPSKATVEIVSTLDNNMHYPLGTGFMADVITSISGTITQVVIGNTGWGYSNFSPYIIITDPGTGAETSVQLLGSSVNSISILNSGSNYTPQATATVFNPPTAGLPNPPTPQASLKVNTSVNTYGTNPNLYWQVWAGTTTNKAIQTQLDQVLSYFKSLGYTISIQSNPSTGSTIVWQISW